MINKMRAIFIKKSALKSGNKELIKKLNELNDKFRNDEGYELSENSNGQYRFKIQNDKFYYFVNEIKEMISSWKLAQERDEYNGACVYKSDKFNLYSGAIIVYDRQLDEMPLLNIVEDIIKNNDYNWYESNIPSNMGKEWNSITQKLISKIKNGEFDDLNRADAINMRILNFIEIECTKIYNSYDCDLNIVDSI